MNCRPAATTMVRPASSIVRPMPYSRRGNDRSTQKGRLLLKASSPPGPGPGVSVCICLCLPTTGAYDRRNLSIARRWDEYHLRDAVLHGYIRERQPKYLNKWASTLRGAFSIHPPWHSKHSTIRSAAAHMPRQINRSGTVIATNLRSGTIIATKLVVKSIRYAAATDLRSLEGGYH